MKPCTHGNTSQKNIIAFADCKTIQSTLCYDLMWWVMCVEILCDVIWYDIATVRYDMIRDEIWYCYYELRDMIRCSEQIQCKYNTINYFVESLVTNIQYTLFLTICFLFAWLMLNGTSTQECQYMPTAGGWNRLGRLRMANETQCIIIFWL